MSIADHHLTKKAWIVGSYCLIYSRSKKKWFDGQIKAISGRHSDEWLHVRYGLFGNFKQSKKIQRNCRDIKCIPRNHPLCIVKGSVCKIHSKQHAKWCSGEVVSVFADNEGEWLKVRYKVHGKAHVVEIQRFSEGVRLLVHESHSPSSSVTLDEETIASIGKLSLSSVAESKSETMDNIDDEHIDEDDEGGRMSDSAYYLYKSTDERDAEHYKPLKVDDQTASDLESETHKNKGSHWNTGATVETFDYTEWMKEELALLLLDVTFTDSCIDISKVKKLEGSATVLLVRGEYRPGFEIQLECKWKGCCYDHDTGKTCGGTLRMWDIAPDEDPDDWEYEARLTKGSTKCLKVVQHGKQVVLDAIQAFVEELYNKKA